eukprot:gene8478-9344_t
MFKKCTYLNERASLLALVVLHVPPDFSQTSSSLSIVASAGGGSGGAEDDSGVVLDESWAMEVLIALQQDLHVEDKYLQAYLSLLPTTCQPSKDSVDVFLNSLHLSSLQRVEVIMRLILSLLSYNKYDGRGRALIRNLAGSLGIPSNDFVFIEKQLAIYIHEHEKVINTILHRKKVLTQREKMIRYAKIGAVSLGAGAVLAVTGGLAAPALAGALLVMGGTSAAAAVSVTTVAAIFGSTGAGLAGYKMMKRTRGVSEFEFELHSEKKGQMAIMIMVSGWMENDEDYKRAFGVLPEILSFQERLIRFYQMHAPERIEKAAEEIEDYELHQDQLFDELMRSTGFDPRDNGNLIAPPVHITPSEITLRGVSNILEELDDQAHSKGFFNMRFMTGKGKEKGGAKASKLDEFGLEETNTDGKSGVQAAATEETTDFGYETLASLVSQSTSAGNHTLNTLQDNDDDEEEDGKHAVETVGESSVPPGIITAKDYEIESALIDASVAPERPVYWQWRNLEISEAYELYLLRWETRLQKDLGSSLVSMAAKLSSSAVQNILAATVFTSLAAAVLWPVFLIKMTDVIDNLWTIAVERADQAGIELAHALLARSYGNRPVTLCGYSMGARVIFSCLRELARVLDTMTKRKASSNPNDFSSSAKQNQPLQTDFQTFSSGDERVESEPGTPRAEANPAAQDNVVRVEQKQSFVKSKLAWLTGSKPSAPSPERPPGESDTIEKEVPDDEGEVKLEPQTSSWEVQNAVDLQGLVQDVILLGAPVSATSRSWSQVRRVVGGRLINGYSNHDLILGLLYRYQRFNFTVAGICPISTDVVREVENVDFTDIVKSHTDYGRRMQDILARLNLLQPSSSPSVVIG